MLILICKKTQCMYRPVTLFCYMYVYHNFSFGAFAPLLSWKASHLGFHQLTAHVFQLWDRQLCIWPCRDRSTYRALLSTITHIKTSLANKLLQIVFNKVQLVAQGKSWNFPTELRWSTCFLKNCTHKFVSHCFSLSAEGFLRFSVCQRTPRNHSPPSHQLLLVIHQGFRL